MPPVAFRRIGSHELALLGTPLAFIALARAPLNYCGLHAVPIVAGLSGIVVITSLLTLRLRLQGPRFQKLLIVALVTVWGDLCLQAASAFTSLPWPVITAVSLASVFMTPMVVWVCAQAATDAEAWKAARSLRRAMWACIIGWILGLVFVTTWAYTPTQTRPSGSGAFVLAAVLFTLPYIMLLLAAQAVRSPNPAGNNCLNCGYSLQGLTAAACPECGKDVRPSALTAHPPHKRRTPWRAIIAQSAAALCVVAAFHYAAHDNGLERYKTLRMLERESNLGAASFRNWSARGGPDRAETPPMLEVLRRADNGLIGTASAQAMADRILERQADPDAPLYLWPEVFSCLDAQGLLTPEQRARFQAQLLRTSLKPLKSPLVEGDQLELELGVIRRAPQPRDDLKHSKSYDLGEPMIVGVWIDDHPVPFTKRGSDSSWASGYRFTINGETPRVPPGTGQRVLRVKFDMVVYEKRDDDAWYPARSYPLVVEAPIQVTKGVAEAVKVVTDPALIEPLLSKWKWTYGRVDRFTQALLIEAPEGLAALPCSVVADLVVTNSPKEIVFGRLVLAEGELRAIVKSPYFWTQDHPDEKLQFSLRPVVEKASSYPGVRSVWAGASVSATADFDKPTKNPY